MQTMSRTSRSVRSTARFDSDTCAHLASFTMLPCSLSPTSSPICLYAIPPVARYRMHKILKTSFSLLASGAGAQRNANKAAIVVSRRMPQWYQKTEPAHG